MIAKYTPFFSQELFETCDCFEYTILQGLFGYWSLLVADDDDENQLLKLNKS